MLKPPSILTAESGAPGAGSQPPLASRIRHLLRRFNPTEPPDPAELAATAWSATLRLLKTQMATSTYELHFEGSQGVTVEAGEILVCLGSATSLGWVEGRLLPTVRRALELAGYDLQPVFTVREGQADG
jgi:hypothetical protein